MQGTLTPSCEAILAESLDRAVELVRGGMPNAAEAVLWYDIRRVESMAPVR